MASMPVRPDRLPPPCPSWIYSNNSDTHTAKDRCWFGTDYIPFRSYVTDIAGGMVEVIGMGTVNLTTMSLPTQTDLDSHSSICLKNVLHTPAMLCNIIGRPIEDDYTIICDSSAPDSSGFILKNTNGRIAAYFKPMGEGPMLYQVQLGAPPLGHEFGISPLCSNGRYMIHAFWSQHERQRFEALMASGLMRASGVEPLTWAENRWLTKRFMSEWGIVLAYGLDYNVKEHREEGRAITRILMSHAKNEPNV
ncbi:hypothetical protein DTO013E5_7865 [Penicillium roqueforti]|uniref:Genomic scaffold, ProqFM164S04 n=1 Tax=Penicillium roqueforti (strain FM164) TaxID=1365484 RepID=W6QF29_PENRF|nr:uncharacterized protein LCP9604111_9194 [Penicillium roqueforti]CDM35363.1 unnamed protein product [Penicillium roqueforti FM164]KAF9239199.1 hypothetical protein LCP9604111_9194 [Penicillium roqueforti]KAI2685832.1 hypothetical protein CBS147355_1319 [Penicillium roqueforti]KAI2705019.1 hypothetical protein CBS147372_1322 [Penicillium roqueforti]KAI2718051.1 hypothetical protein CBS147318_4628 [Penicillium roqueforti]